MDWKDYEEITKYIYETLGKQSGVEIICQGNSCKVKGKSSVEHQIDVLTNHYDGIHSYKTAIECKYWDKNINKDIVMKVSEIVEDANLNKGVIVSKLGFTPDAISYAEYKNIGLVELREFTDDDWKGRIKDIVISLNAQFAEVTGVELMLDPSATSTLKSGKNAVELLQIRKSSGEIVEFADYVQDFQKEVYEQPEDVEFERHYSLDKGAFIIYTPTLEETPIIGLKFKGVLKVAREKIEIKGGDHIWLIMKLVFENKTYTITKDKDIRERKE